MICHALLPTSLAPPCIFWQHNNFRVASNGVETFEISPDNHWVVVSNMFYFHPYLGAWSNLTNIFFSNGLVQPPTRSLTFLEEFWNSKQPPWLPSVFRKSTRRHIEEWCWTWFEMPSRRAFFHLRPLRIGNAGVVMWCCAQGTRPPHHRLICGKTGEEKGVFHQ